MGALGHYPNSLLPSLSIQKLKRDGSLLLELCFCFASLLPPLSFGRGPLRWGSLQHHPCFANSWVLSLVPFVLPTNTTFSDFAGLWCNENSGHQDFISLRILNKSSIYIYIYITQLGSWKFEKMVRILSVYPLINYCWVYFS